jgi:hypothetical protein
MVGTAARKTLLALVPTAALLAALTACAAVPSSTGSALPSGSPDTSPSPTATATATVSATATASASPTPSGSGNLGALTGTWKGTWLNESPQTAAGTFSLSWAQQGDKVFGAIGVVGSTCLSGGNVTGSVSGSVVTFGAVEGNNTINYTGTVSGNTMSGTYTSACGNSRGTWSAVKA